MNRLLLSLSLAVGAWIPSDVETRVLQRIQQMMKETGGRVTFSDLHNDNRFDADEKAFLERLYEIFFQVPGFLAEHYRDTGEIPTRSRIGQHFEIAPVSVELLLRVMQSDSRVPPMFERDATSGEISSLDLGNIQQFLQARGDQVRITQWEGRPLPGFELETLDGGVLKRSDLLGRHSLIYFWFSGCPPCVRIAPILSELDREYRDRGLQIIGFNADRVLEIEVTEEQRANYLNKSRTAYRNAHIDEQTRRAFGSVNVYPMLFFVDEEGVIVRHMLNFQDEATLATVIEQMLQE